MGCITQQINIKSMRGHNDAPPFFSFLTKQSPFIFGYGAMCAQSAFWFASHLVCDGVVQIHAQPPKPTHGGTIACVYPNFIVHT
jgi:hypothetical protein